MNLPKDVESDKPEADQSQIQDQIEVTENLPVNPETDGVGEEDVTETVRVPLKGKSKGLSVTSLVFGILSLILLPLGLVLGLVAVICGSKGAKRGGGGMASAGLVTGIIGMVFGFVAAGIIALSAFLVLNTPVESRRAHNYNEWVWEIPDGETHEYII